MSYEKERAIYEDKQRDYNVARIARKIQRRVAHKEFVKHTRKFLIAMDVMVVLLLLANFGAVIMTNALVVRATPNMTLMEGNPVQSKINNYVEHPQAKEFMNALFIQALVWTLLLSFYIYARTHMFMYHELWVTGFILIFYFYVIYYDFFNDLGFFIGKVLFGGG